MYHHYNYSQVLSITTTINVSLVMSITISVSMLSIDMYTHTGKLMPTNTKDIKSNSKLLILSDLEISVT